MSTFKNIRGQLIKSVASDPANAGGGDMWYNSTSQVLKGVVASGAWSSTSPVNTARSDLAGFGIQTAAVGAGGYITGAVANVEEYNGSGWSNATAIPTATNSLGGFGILTAGVVAGGVSGVPVRPAATFEYDGTSWTGGGNLNTGRQNGTGAGTLTAGLLFGSSNPNSNLCEEYNGTAWTAVNAMNRPSINNMSAGGVQTAAYGAGGYIPGSGNSNGTENYDGTNWTTSGNIPAARRSSRGSGTQTDGIMAGGNGPGITTAVLNYNGTTWSVNPASLATAREGTASSQNAPASTTLISFGYDGSGRSSLSEEYNFSVNIITPGAWASGGALGTARDKAGGFGIQTAAAVVGGETPALTTATEEYNGSSWTAGGAYPTAFAGITALGTQTAGVGFGGYVPPGYTNQTNEYDGSSWTTVNNYPQTSNSSGACGTLTAGLGFGGDNTGVSPRNTTTTAEYDGTNWTAGGALGTGGYLLRGAGTQTAAAAVGGQGRASLTEEYNGSSWTAGGAPLAPVSGGGTSQAGTQDAFIYISTSPSAFTQKYDGTVFSTSPSLATGRTNGSGAGTSTAGLYAGGRAPAFSTATEEFTGETTAANVKTFTTS